MCKARAETGVDKGYQLAHDAWEEENTRDDAIETAHEVLHHMLFNAMISEADYYFIEEHLGRLDVNHSCPWIVRSPHLIPAAGLLGDSEFDQPDGSRWARASLTAPLRPARPSAVGNLHRRQRAILQSGDDPLLGSVEIMGLNLGLNWA